MESRCCICCVHVCVPLVMPGVWVASVAGRRTEKRGARLHVGAIASTKLMTLGSMCWAGAQIQTAQLLSAFAGAWRLVSGRALLARWPLWGCNRVGLGIVLDSPFVGSARCFPARRFPPTITIPIGRAEINIKRMQKETVQWCALFLGCSYWPLVRA